MKEYIEREATLKELHKVPAYFDSGDIRYGIQIAIDIVEKQLTADVAEVKHGEWKEHDRYVCNSDGKPVAKIDIVYICSECGRQEYRKEPYCHCGVKMDKKDGDT